MIACSTLGAVATIAALVARTKDPSYAGTIVWALIAIGIQQEDFPPVRWTARISAGLLALVLLWKLKARSVFYAVGPKAA